MAWKYAVFTVMCPACDLEETAALASEAGLDGLEWRVTKKAPEPITEVSYWGANRSTVDIEDVAADLKRAKAIADRYSLVMPVLGTYMKCEDLDLVEAAMRAAQEVGVPKMRVGTPLYDGSRPYGELFEEAVGHFKQVATLARKYRVQACIEMHMGNITPSAGLAHRLVSKFDPSEVGVIFDPGNMVVEGFENYQMGLELLGPYLSHVHAKNVLWEKTGEENGAAKWQWKMAAVTEGQADWTAIVRALKKVAYDGWLSFEDFSAGDTKQKLTAGVRYLRKLEAEID